VSCVCHTEVLSAKYHIAQLHCHMSSIFVRGKVELCVIQWSCLFVVGLCIVNLDVVRGGF
jgi:hypothetical protein